MAQYSAHSSKLFSALSSPTSFGKCPWGFQGPGTLSAAIPPLSRKKNFSISYLGWDRLGQEAYLSLLSDWDLSTAFITASKPYLQLRVDIRPTEDSEYLVPQGHCYGTHPFPIG